MNNEKMLYLLSDTDNQIWTMIYDVLDNEASPHSPWFIEHMIECYFRVSAMCGDELPYRTVEEYFCYYNPVGRKQYDEFLKIKNQHVRENFEIDDVLFLLNYSVEEICELVRNALIDSFDDPHYSPIAATNMIKCYIDIANSKGCDLPFGDVRSFFAFYGFSKRDFDNFERRRIVESAYSKRIQF